MGLGNWSSGWEEMESENWDSNRLCSMEDKVENQDISLPGDARVNSRSVFKTDTRTAKNNSQINGDKWILSRGGRGACGRLTFWIARALCWGLGWSGSPWGVADLTVCQGPVLVTYWLRTTGTEPIFHCTEFFPLERGDCPDHPTP